jgi:hypothetical protein
MQKTILRKAGQFSGAKIGAKAASHPPQLSSAFPLLENTGLLPPSYIIGSTPMEARGVVGQCFSHPLGSWPKSVSPVAKKWFSFLSFLFFLLAKSQGK